MHTTEQRKQSTFETWTDTIPADGVWSTHRGARASYVEVKRPNGTSTRWYGEWVAVQHVANTKTWPDAGAPIVWRSSW